MRCIAIVSTVFLGITSFAADKPYKPSADDLAIRATGSQILSSCGQPTKQWKSSSGKGQFLTITEHLWYAKVPAEILLVEYPNNPSLHMEQQTFYGGSPSLKTNDMYEPKDLARRMPCVARWANVYARINESIISGKK